MIHIWTEDSENSCTVQFWRFITSKLCNGAEIDIKGFSSYTKIYTYVSKNVHQMNDGVYILLIDNVKDNYEVAAMYNRISAKIENNHRIYLSDLHSFEYMILTFKELSSWISSYKEYEYIIEELRKIVEADKNVEESAILSKINTSNKRISTEKIASIVLKKMTKSSSGDFLISKTYLGSCWTCDCCSIQDNDMCSIKEYEMTALNKAYTEFYKSYAKCVIHAASVYFEKFGIEV